MNKKIKKSLIITTAATMGMGVVLPTVSVLAAPAALNGWTYQNNTWYYYQNGMKLKNGWQKDSTGWCFLNAIDGSWVKEGWAKDSHGWGYIRNGYWVERATWAKDSKGWNYIGPDGYYVASIASKATNPIEDAAAAVTKAEATELQTDVDSAQVLVTSLDNEINEKVDLTTRIDKVKYYLNLGNRASNLNYEGIAAKRGEWIYYSNYNDGYKLYCIKTDGTSKTKLSDNGAFSINIKDGWIYYIDFIQTKDANGATIDTKKTLCKMKTDGTSKTKLLDNYANCIYVVGDWIFYTDLIEGKDVYGFPNSTYTLSKMKTDGTSKIKLTEEGRNLNVVGDWIYYLDATDHKGYEFDNAYRIYKIKTDGTSKTAIGNNYAHSINVSGDWIYGIDRGDGLKSRIFKMKTDGTSKTTVCDDVATEINVVGGWIYYTNHYDVDTNLYKIKTDGTSKTRLTNLPLNKYNTTDPIDNINIVGDWIFYINVTDIDYTNGIKKTLTQYKMKTDGTQITKIGTQITQIR